jgi:hypothetical protein
MSDTPRTDRVLNNCNGWHHVPIGMARELERELNATNDRIKRLEEAGDAMEYSTVVLESGEDLIEKLLIAQRAWRKAKEAKP